MRALALLVAACAACGAARPALTPPQAPAPLEEPEEHIEPQKLVADLRGTILESYQQIAGGYDEAYLDGIARDARLILIDVKPEDVVIGYEPAACRVRRHFPDLPLQLVSSSLEIHLSADHTVAWTHDDLSYRVARNGRRATIPLRATAVYERREGRWLKVMEHVSYALREDESAREPPPAPAPIVDDTPTGEAAAQVRAALVGLLGDDAAVRARALSGDEDALLIGSAPDDEARGPAVVARGAFRKRVRPAGLRIQVSRSGQVAWAAGNLLPEGGPEQRASWVLERRGGDWRVVQSHMSVPLTREQLAQRVFGEAVTIR